MTAIKKVVPLLILPCLMGIKIGEGCKRESKGNMESNLCAVTCTMIRIVAF